MKRLKHAFLRNGRITFLGSLLLLLLGLVVGYASLEYLPSKVLKLVGASIGLGIGALGGYSGRASALNLPALFTNDPIGWRKAKKTYKAPDEDHKSEEP